MAKSDKNKNKLTGEQKRIIIHMLAAYFTNKEIVDYLNEYYSIQITNENVTYYSKKRKEEIREAREEFKKTVGYLPVAQKIYRIKLRQDLINDLLKENNLWIIVKTKYGYQRKPNHGIINKILDSVRDELESRKMSITDPTGKKDMIDRLNEILENAKKAAEKVQTRMEAAASITTGNRHAEDRAKSDLNGFSVVD